MTKSSFRVCKTLTALVLLALLSSSALAQSEIDSLKRIWTNTNLEDTLRFKALNVYYPQYSHAYPDSALHIADYHIKLAQGIQNNKQEAIALNEKVIAYMVKGEFDKAINPLNKAITLRTELQDTMGVARLKTNLGNIYRSKYDYLSAFRYYYSSLETYYYYKDTVPMAKTLSNLGLLFYDIKKYDVATDYWMKAKNLYKAMGTEEEVGYIWLNLGALHLANEEYNKALSNCSKAEHLFKKNNLQYFVADCNFIQAKIHQKLGNNDSSLAYIKESLRINKVVGNRDQVALGQVMLAELTMERDLDASTIMVEKVLKENATSTNTELRRDIYATLHQCYKKQGYYDKALAMHELSISYIDSLDLEERQLVLVREQVVTDFNKKLEETRNEAAKTKKELEHAQLKKLLSLLAGGIIILGGLFYWYRKRIGEKDLERDQLLLEIKRLKDEQKTSLTMAESGFQLAREKLEAAIGKKINETDWKVLNILLDDPVISNKGIAERAFLTVDGIGSSLRRMYVAFDIKESKYKKISLLMNAMKMSNS